MVMWYLVTHDPEEENESFGALHACSLTQRRWRRSAQQAFHSVVHIWPDISEHKHRHYSPSREPLGANLHLYPRDLSVESYDTKSTEELEHLFRFAGHCGECVASLGIREVNFVTFNDLLKLLSYFPHLTEITITDCTWEDTDSVLWCSCDDLSGCRCAAPSAPVSLRWACVDGYLRRGTIPLPLSQWLMHSREGTDLEVVCELKFSVTGASAIDTSEALRVLGPSLRYLMLDVEVTVAWGNGECLTCLILLQSCSPFLSHTDFQRLKFPNLAHNTRLRSLRINNVVPGFCPPNYLASIFSNVESPELESVTIEFVFDDMTLQDADSFDFDRFDRLLSDRSRLPALKHVSFMAAQDDRDVDEQPFSDYILSKVPLINGRNDIEVEIVKVYWANLSQPEEREDDNGDEDEDVDEDADDDEVVGIEA